MKRLARTTWTLNPIAPRLGSEWYEAVIRAGLQGYGGPPHGDETRWDWGVTFRTLMDADQRRKRLEQVAAELTDEQRAMLWAEDSPVARELRSVLR